MCKICGECKGAMDQTLTEWSEMKRVEKSRISDLKGNERGLIWKKRSAIKERKWMWKEEQRGAKR